MQFPPVIVDHNFICQTQFVSFLSVGSYKQDQTNQSSNQSFDIQQKLIDFIV